MQGAEYLFTSESVTEGHPDKMADQISDAVLDTLLSHIAKNIVAAGLARRAEVQLAYAIGVSEPVSLMITTFGTGTSPEAKLPDLVRRLFPVRPTDIVEQLDLLRPIFRATAVGGHFGRHEAQFTWEQTDRVAQLQADSQVRQIAL